MAKGKAIGRLEALLGLVGVLALGTTYALITGWDPVRAATDGLSAWASRSGSIAEPDAAWTRRIGGQPSTAFIAGRVAVVVTRGRAEAHDLATGEIVWSHRADWVAAAGDPAATRDGAAGNGAVAGDGASAVGAVVVAGRGGRNGYEVLAAATGAALWSDDSAIGAWTFRDAVLSWTCPGLADCTLTSRAPADGAVRWKATLPGLGRSLDGGNTPLPGARELAAAYADALAGAARPVPPVLGFPLDRRVQALDTAGGRVLRRPEPSERTRIVVIAGRELHSTAVRADAGCRYSLQARDPASGATLWTKEGYDLGTASGIACEQRRDPGGSDAALAATRADNRPVLLSPRDGRELWVGAAGETVLAVGGRYAAVRSGKRLAVVSLENGAVAWGRDLVERAEVAVTPFAVLVTGGGIGSGGQLLALEPATGRTLVDVKTRASVLGIGPAGLMINEGRTVGYLAYR